MVTLSCLAKKNLNLNLRKKVQFSTENGDMLSFPATNHHFQTFSSGLDLDFSLPNNSG
jgi:hypothetical protein